jgi:hypothetical protein
MGDKMGGACSVHGGHNKIVNTFVGNLKGTDHSKGIGVGGRIILKWILGNRVWELIGFIWFRTGTGGWLL